MMERVVAIPNETNAHTSRVTRDGRKITYKLKVLQQPERARACGSGAKSSADRRPVDPPPIVELRIYEGENEDKDVTFQLSANYFLFATLEQARPIAQGRVAHDPSRATVLTGTPVAGMVYLDRPEPAGYFIFPDLSVRHEGKYRLGFSLYEELKDMKDADRVDENDSKAQGLGEAHVTHRLEVRSMPFTVFSAKKFPGLASSTSLSRTVAEQGCRVRIRRDVRMRRREKPGKDGYDGYSDGGFDRARHSATPDMYQQHISASRGMLDHSGRERTGSISSHTSLIGPPESRRTSMQEMPQMYTQTAYAPPAPAPPGLQSAPLPQAQYGAPIAPGYPAHYPYQQGPMQPPQMSYPGYQYSQPAAPVNQQGYHYAQPTQQAPMPQYDAHSHMRHPSGDYGAPAGSDSRRSSSIVTAASYSYGQQGQAVRPQHASHSNGNSASGYGVGSTSREAAQAPVATTMTPSQTSMANHVLPPINTTLQSRDKIEPSTPTTISPSHGYYSSGINQAADSRVQAGSKRGYERVFGSSHMNESLRHGARPTSPYSYGHSNGLAIEAGNEHLGGTMLYRRADGREIARPLPPSI